MSRLLALPATAAPAFAAGFGYGAVDLVNSFISGGAGCDNEGRRRLRTYGNA